MTVREAVRSRSGGRCEVRHPGCTGRLDGYHHRYKPGRKDTRENLVAVCDSCHTLGADAIHRNIDASIANGLLLRSWDGLPDVEWSRPSLRHGALER
jgi:hypothetical protein